MNNPTTTDPTFPPPQPPPLPPRSSFSCDRHPNENFNGFCPSCLCERLTCLDQNLSSSNTPSSSSRRPSSVAVKSLFSNAPKPVNLSTNPVRQNPGSFLPELRRSKSFSASKNEALLGFGCVSSFEPQRKSCDVRGRNSGNTLWSLFSLDDQQGIIGNNNSIINNNNGLSCTRTVVTESKIESFVANKPVFEQENVENYCNVVENVVDDCNVDEIRPVFDTNMESLRRNVGENEIVEEEFVSLGSSSTSIKRMKECIDIDTHEKKGSSGGGGGGGGGFWAAASVFSKKWQKWRRKQKTKKQNNGGNLLGTLPVEKPISRQFRETQSEIADYGYGRRSCDTDPRFSLDAGRISFDDPRYSFDEPRASWDGCLVGRSFPRMAAPMVSVMEDASPAVHVPRSDMQIPVEEPGRSSLDSLPGGSLQTKEYYSDSSSRRRKSLDRSSSTRKSNVEIEDLKMVSNAKVSPTTLDYFQQAKVMGLRDSNSQSLRDDCSEATFELSNGFIRDSGNRGVIGNGDRDRDRKETKKSRRWSWRIWGFIHKRNGGNKEEDDEEKYSRVNGNGVERSLSESWKERNGDTGGRNVYRSNSSASWRSSSGNPIKGSSFGSVRKTGFEMNGNGNGNWNGKNRSGRYSSPNNHVDNGLLRFYLTPMRGSRRGLKPNNSNSIARSVLRLY